MRVELDAKVASGYQSMDSFHKEEIAAQLDNLSAVRRQCARLYELAQKDELFHFTLDEAKLVEAVDFTEKEIRANYPDLQVPDLARLGGLELAELGVEDLGDAGFRYVVLDLPHVPERMALARRLDRQWGPPDAVRGDMSWWLTHGSEAP